MKHIRWCLTLLAALGLWCCAVAQDQAAEKWAERLNVYEASNDPGAKGYFGSPSGTVQKLLECRARYLEAKALYAEFLKSGIDKDSHYALRDAEYSIRVSIDNYEQSTERLISRAEEAIKGRADWIAGQLTAKNPLRIPPLAYQELLDQGNGVCQLLPDGDARRTALEATMAKMRKDQAAVDKLIVKSRMMKDDAYKGDDAAKIKAVAKAVAAKELAKDEYAGKAATILRVHIISSRWNTDTTKSAVQYRVTKGVNVQVVAKSGTSCYLFTLFVHEDQVSGSSSGLLGHVMFRDDFLESNLPK